MLMPDRGEWGQVCRRGHNGGSHPRPGPGGAGYNQGEPPAPSMGCGALSCGRRAWDCSLAPGPLSFGSLPNLIKCLYVPAALQARARKPRARLRVNEPWTHCSAATLTGMAALCLPSQGSRQQRWQGDRRSQSSSPALSGGQPASPPRQEV